jgi:uncharacterized protein (TIGR02217 family)
MSFDETRLPIEVERGAQGGPGFLTTVTVLNSGREKRNSLWSVDRGEWDVGFGINTREEALKVRNFFMARLGKARGFRFRDWSNYKTEGSQQMGVAESPDSGDTTFQIQYTYQDESGFTYTKNIYKPVAEGFQVYLDGVAQLSGWNIDTTTGIITFADPPDYGVDITWTGTFDLPVRFDTDRLDIVVENKEVLITPSIPIVELKL